MTTEQLEIKLIKNENRNRKLNVIISGLIRVERSLYKRIKLLTVLLGISGLGNIALLAVSFSNYF